MENSTLQQLINQTEEALLQAGGEYPKVCVNLQTDVR